MRRKDMKEEVSAYVWLTQQELTQHRKAAVLQVRIHTGSKLCIERERKPGPRTAESVPLGNGVGGELWATGPQGVGPAPRPQETLQVILTHTRAGRMLVRSISLNPFLQVCKPHSLPPASRQKVTQSLERKMQHRAIIGRKKKNRHRKAICRYCHQSAEKSKPKKIKTWLQATIHQQKETSSAPLSKL